MTRLVVTADAAADTTDILIYLEREAGPVVAQAYGERFRAAAMRLVDFPASGAPRPVLGDDARIVIVAPYLLIYDYIPGGDVVTLLRILHGRRNITRDLLRR
jgi:plasmid stabilization system protein ParE